MFSPSFQNNPLTTWPSVCSTSSVSKVFRGHSALFVMEFFVCLCLGMCGCVCVCVFYRLYFSQVSHLVWQNQRAVVRFTLRAWRQNRYCWRWVFSRTFCLLCQQETYIVRVAGKNKGYNQCIIMVNCPTYSPWELKLSETPHSSPVSFDMTFHSPHRCTVYVYD